MPITQDNLLKNYDDREWIAQYESKMGKEDYQRYANKVYDFIQEMPAESEIIVSKFVAAANEDLFAKHVCRLAFMECFNLQFSPDFKKLRKFDNKKETNGTEIHLDGGAN